MQIEWFKMRTAWWYAVQNMTDKEAGIFLKCIYAFVCEDQEEYGNGREMLTCMQAIGTLKNDFKGSAFLNLENPDETQDERKARISEVRRQAGRKGAQAKLANSGKTKQNVANEANSGKTDFAEANLANQANCHIREEENREDKNREECVYEEEEEEVAHARERLIDPDWKMVADAYQREIGMLPMGTALDVLTSYVDDLGGDVVCKAIEITNSKTPDNPHQFLVAILKSFEKNGIDSREKAEAYLKDRERRKNSNGQRNASTGGLVDQGAGQGTGGNDPRVSERERANFKRFQEYLESTHI